MVLLGSSGPASASHVAFGELTVQSVDAATRRVTFSYHQRLNRVAGSSSLRVDFGDGTSDTFGPLAFPGTTGRRSTATHSYFVFYDDVEPGNTVTVTHTYPSPRTYTVSWTDDGVGGAISATIPGDTVPPVTVASPSGTLGDNDWFVSSVTVQFAASDNPGGTGVRELHYSVDGGPDQVVPGNRASVVVGGDGTHSVGYYAVDNFGNIELVRRLTVLVDRTSPVVEAVREDGCQANSCGWNNGPVSVRFSATDATSGIVGEATATVTAAGEGEHQSVSSPVFRDAAGNTASGSLGEISIDRTPPTIHGSVQSPDTYGGADASGNNWYNQPVTVRFDADDALSGIAAVTPAAEQVLSTQGANQSASATAKDRADNEATATVGGLNIDTAGPEITIQGADSYLLGAGGRPTFTAADALSGVNPDRSSDAVSALTVSPTGVGSYRYTAFATDYAGNASERYVEFQVVYDFGDFLSPVANKRVFKAGSTIPVKFQLRDAAGRLIANAGIRSIEVTHLSIDAATGEPEPGTTESPTGEFRYDAAGQQYHMNWSTKGRAMGQHQFTVTLDDGTQHSFIASLR
jgi:hypothetical protein